MRGFPTMTSLAKKFLDVSDHIARKACRLIEHREYG
jgi:hypothetical protein